MYLETKQTFTIIHFLESLLQVSDVNWSILSFRQYK